MSFKKPNYNNAIGTGYVIVFDKCDGDNTIDEARFKEFKKERSILKYEIDDFGVKVTAENSFFETFKKSKEFCAIKLN